MTANLIVKGKDEKALKDSLEKLNYHGLGLSHEKNNATSTEKFKLSAKAYIADTSPLQV